MKLSESNQLKLIGLIGMWIGVAIAAYHGHTNYVGWGMFVTFLIVN
jgi:hypothetical protein